MLLCETNVIEVGSCVIGSLVNNGNGTHTFYPGDGSDISFNTSYLASASFDSSTREVTLTMSDGTEYTYTIDVPTDTTLTIANFADDENPTLGEVNTYLVSNPQLAGSTLAYSTPNGDYYVWIVKDDNTARLIEQNTVTNLLASHIADGAHDALDIAGNMDIAGSINLLNNQPITIENSSNTPVTLATLDATDVFKFGNNVINVDGVWVGIGTDSPSSLLTLAQAADNANNGLTIEPSTGDDFRIYIDGSNNVQFRKDSVDVIAISNIGETTFSEKVILADSLTALEFTDAGTPRIDAVNNLSIRPVNILTVYSDGEEAFRVGVNQKIQIGSTSGLGQFNVTSKATTRETLVVTKLAGQTANLFVVEDENNADYFTIDNDGKVNANAGFRIQGPTAQLELYDSDEPQEWQLRASGKHLYIEPNTSNGDIIFRNYANATLLRLYNTANTATIFGDVDVDGSTYITGDLDIGDGASFVQVSLNSSQVLANPNDTVNNLKIGFGTFPNWNGSYTVAVGPNAGGSATISGTTTLIGGISGYNATLNGSVGIGYYSLRDSTAALTTAIGNFAGYLSTANNSLYLGYAMGRSNTINGTLEIGAYQGFPIISGIMSNTAIQELSLNANVEVGGDFIINGALTTQGNPQFTDITSALIVAGTTNAIIDLQSPAGGRPQIWHTIDGTVEFRAGVVDIDTYRITPGLLGSITGITLKSDGKVGINKGAPSAELEVKGSAIISGVDSTEKFTVLDATDDAVLQVDTSVVQVISNGWGARFVAASDRGTFNAAHGGFTLYANHANRAAELGRFAWELVNPPDALGGVGIRLSQKKDDGTSAANSGIMGVTAGVKTLEVYQDFEVYNNDDKDELRFAIDVSASIVSVADDFAIVSPTVPSNATDTGTTGQIAWDSSYIYVCTATNTWVRAALATW